MNAKNCMFVYFVRIIFVWPEIPEKFMKFWHLVLFIELLATRAKNNNNKYAHARSSSSSPFPCFGLC